MSTRNRNTNDAQSYRFPTSGQKTQVTLDPELEELRNRIGARFAKRMTLAEKTTSIPVVGFDVLVGMPAGAENLVSIVVRTLKARGWRVGYVARVGALYTSDDNLDLTRNIMALEPDGMVLAAEGIAMTAHKTKEEPTLDQMLSMLEGEYDVVVAENFGLVPIPRIIVTDKPNEAFNMGLPGLVAYVSTVQQRNMLPWYAVDDTDQIAIDIENNIIFAHNPQAIPSLPVTWIPRKQAIEQSTHSDPIVTAANALSRETTNQSASPEED